MDIEKVVFHALTQFLALAQKEAIPVSYTHLMQKNVLQLCRMTRYVCAQKDSVRAISCADECRGVKVKRAVLCISAVSYTHLIPFCSSFLAMPRPTRQKSVRG